MIKFGQISIIIFAIIFGLGLLMLGMRSFGTNAIAYFGGPSKQELLAKVEFLEKRLAEELAAKEIETEELASSLDEVEEIDEVEEVDKIAEADETNKADESEADSSNSSNDENGENAIASASDQQAKQSQSRLNKESKFLGSAANQKPIASTYKVIAGCFGDPDYAARRVALLNDLGYPANAKKLRGGKQSSSSLNSVVVNRYDNYTAALEDIVELRDDHELSSYLVKKGRTTNNGTSVFMEVDFSDPYLPKFTKGVSMRFAEE